MNKSIGMARGLMYHFQAKTWESFFEKLGAEVRISPPSTKKTLNQGTNISMIDNCLPLKLYFGHIRQLLDTFTLDYIFVPRMKSIVKGEHLCPKFIGLPDLIEQYLCQFSKPPQVLSPVIDYNQKQTFYRAAYQVKEQFNIPKSTFLKALLSARYNYKLEHLNLFQAPNQGASTVAVIAHEYVLQDELLGVPILNKLNEMGYNVITSKEAKFLPKPRMARQFIKQLYWTKNKHIVNSVLYLAENNLVDGIIQINTFPCGPDSVMSDLLEKKITSNTSIPFTILTLDEHTGLSGIYTRLEAFVDLIHKEGVL